MKLLAGVGQVRENSRVIENPNRRPQAWLVREKGIVGITCGTVGVVMWTKESHRRDIVTIDAGNQTM